MSEPPRVRRVQEALEAFHGEPVRREREELAAGGRVDVWFVHA